MESYRIQIVSSVYWTSSPKKCYSVYFVQKFPYIFGTEYVTYNVHNLIHLAEDVKTHGSLDSFSTFNLKIICLK
nr:unnamed protein product [Callosobruchus analis]